LSQTLFSLSFNSWFEKGERKMLDFSGKEKKLSFTPIQAMKK
jgi:hypothetical protein